jgi:holo-[acyl-carrier protein] synthase
VTPPTTAPVTAPTDGRLGRRLERSAAGLGTDPSVRVGIDLVEVAEVAESVRRFGDRYLNRIFTPHELASCRGASGPGGAYSAESLAARFAAKEAVLKVLRPVGPRPEWRSIEVHRSDAGWCGIRLRGRAAGLAARAHLTDFTVSLTHESMMAVAIVMATVRPGARLATGVETGHENTSVQRTSAERKA